MYSKSKRFIASFLAVLMAVCMLPVEMFGGVGVVNAAEGVTVSITGKDLLASGEHVTLTTGENTQNIEDSATVDLTDGDEYTVACTDTTLNVATSVGGTPAADNKFTAESTTTAITITLTKKLSTTTVSLSKDEIKAGEDVPEVTVTDADGSTVDTRDYVVEYYIDVESTPTKKSEAELKALTVADGTEVTVTVKVTAASTSTTYTGSAADKTFKIKPATTVTPGDTQTVLAASMITIADTVLSTTADTDGAYTTTYTDVYTASMTWPTIVVKKDASATPYAENTDYALTYQKVASDGSATTASAIDGAGTYKITVTPASSSADSALKGSAITVKFVITAAGTVTGQKNRRLNMEGVTAGTYEEDFTKNGFTLLAPFTVDGNEKTDTSVTPNVKYKQRFKMQNGTDCTDGKVTRSIMFTTQGAASVIIWAMAGNSESGNEASAEISKLESSSLVKVSDFNNGNVIGGNKNDFAQYTASVTEAGTYYINANNGKSFNIYNIEVRYPGVGTSEEDYDDDAQVKVSFNVDGGLTVADQDVVVGGKCPEPATIKDGYVLEGWYTDEALTNKFDFSTSITSATTLYAKWVEDIDRVNNVLNMKDLPNGDYAEQFIKNGFTIIGKSGATVSVAPATPPSEEPTYTKVLKTNGKSSKDSRLISFKISEDSTLKVVAVASGSGSRTLYLGTTIPQKDIGTASNIPTDAVAIKESSDTNIFTVTKELTASEETTYYMYTTNGFNIYYISVVPDNSGSTPETVSAPEATPATTAVAATATEVEVGETVTLESETTGASIVYAISTDGTEPTDEAVTIPYTAPIELDTEGTTIIKAKATKTDATDSDIVTFVYTVKAASAVAKPTISPATGTQVTEDTDITITADTNAVTGTKIYYTVGTTLADTADPVKDATGTTEYSDPFKLGNNLVVKAIAVSTINGADVASNVAQAVYTAAPKNVANLSVKVTVAGTATPLENNDAIEVSSSDIVRFELKTDTEGASIYYTTDGTEPTADNATPYTSEAATQTTYSEDTTVKAIAVKAGYEPSAVFTFTIDVQTTTGPNDPDDPDDDDYGDVWDDDVAYAKKTWGQIPDGLWIAGVRERGYYYNYGSKVTPASDDYWGEDYEGIHVYHGKTLLTEKVDYTISYKNNVNVPKTDAANKQPTIVVKGKGNYSGSATKTFKILPCNLSDEIYDYDEMAIVAKKNGKGQKPIPVVTVYDYDRDKEIKLKNKTDFTVKYYKAADQADPVESETVAEASLLNEVPADPGVYFARLTEGSNKNYTGTYDIKLTVIDANSTVIPASKLKVTVKPVTYSKEEATKDGFKGYQPEVKVKAGGTELTKDTDYTLSYWNNDEPGTASVFIMAKPATDGTVKFVGTKTARFKIKGVAIKSYKVNVPNTALDFTGDISDITTNVEEALTVKKGSTELKRYGAKDVTYADADYNYRVKLDNEEHPTKVNVTIYGLHQYEGSVTKTFKIRPLAVTDSKVKITVDYPSTPAEQADGDDATTTTTQSIPLMKGGAKPTVTAECILKNSEDKDYVGHELVEGIDYTLSYSNNKKVGPAKITFKGKGLFKGSTKIDFTIGAKPFSDGVTLVVSDVAVNNAGNYDCKPVLLDADGVKLTNKKDYTVEYYDITPAKSEEQEPAPAPSTSILEGDNNGTEGDGSNTNAGPSPITNIKKYKTASKGSQFKVVIKEGSSKTYTGTLEAKYEVREKNFAKVKVAKISPKEITGKPITLTNADLTVTLAGTPLTPYDETTKQGDYKIDVDSYVNNTKKGTAKVTLKGMNDYAGSKIVTFKITAKKMAWWEKPAAPTTPSEALDYLKNAVTGLFN